MWISVRAGIMNPITNGHGRHIFNAMCKQLYLALPPSDEIYCLENTGSEQA